MSEERPEEELANEPRRVGGKPPEPNEDSNEETAADMPSEEIEDPAEGEAPSG